MGEVRSREDLEKALETQRQSLISFNELYDGGKKKLMIWAAASVHVIVAADGTRNASILSQLGDRASMRLLSSVPPYLPGNVVRYTPMVGLAMRGDGTSGAIPLCSIPLYRPQQHWLPFEAWWKDEIIFEDGNYQLNRQRLVGALRNKEGGGHIDREITDNSYLRMAREQITTPRSEFSIGSEVVSTPYLDVELVSMRQIAWEMLQSLDVRTFLKGAKGSEFKIGPL